MARLRRHRLRITRDTILLVIGIAGLLHETLRATGQERPTLIFVYAAMIGLPVFMRLDERTAKE